MSKPENTKVVTTIKKDISESVLSKVNAFQETGELILPVDYSAENALKSAYLVLSETKNKDGKFALDHCSKESIANALLKMVVWGLSPLKKQFSSVMYGTTLECVQEYTGNIALAKRYGGLKSIKGAAIFEGDEFDFEVDPKNGLKKITSHKQTLESLGSKNIKGAYAVYEKEDGTVDTEIMNIAQIRAAWMQGGSNGDSPAHKNFPDQMAIKTVINRACKLIIRGSNDSILYDATDKEIDTIEVEHEEVRSDIIANANQEVLKMDIDEEPKNESIETKIAQPQF